MGTIPLITSLTDPRNLVTIATFALVLILGIFASTKNGRAAKILMVSLSLIVFPYLPASNLFFPVGFVIAERVLYLPSMGFCLLVGYGSSLLLQRRSTHILTKVMLIFLLLSQSMRTLVRNRDWVSDKELFSSAVGTNPGNGKVYNNLGHEFEHHEELDTAERLFRRASQVQPDDIGAFINLGRILKARERYSEAEKVGLLSPNHLDVYSVYCCS